MTQLESLPQILYKFQIFQTVLPDSWFLRIKWDNIGYRRLQARQHASAHTPHHSLHCQTFLKWSWLQIFPQTHPISWGSAHELGCGVPVCSYKHTLQTAVKRVHPKWECLTRKRLNQLLNKRVHPFPPLITWTILYHHNQHLSSSPPCEISWKKSIYVI